MHLIELCCNQKRRLATKRTRNRKQKMYFNKVVCLCWSSNSTTGTRRRRRLPFNFVCLLLMSIQHRVHAFLPAQNHPSSTRRRRNNNAYPSSSSVIVLSSSSSSTGSNKDFKKRKQDNNKKASPPFGGGGGGGSSNPTKRRFGQTAHKQQQQQQEQSDERTTEKSSSSSSNNKSSNKNHDKDGVYGSSSASVVQKDLMWKSRKKSIDELEDIMTRRWGTDLKAWTATDIDDYDDNDGDEDNEKKEPRFRARPVKDPWQKSVETKRTTTPRDNKNKNDSMDKKQKTFFRSNDNDKLSVNDRPPSRREYYDEDDVGYEAATTSDYKQRHDDNKKKRISVNHVINPKPVGGRGSISDDYEVDDEEENDDDDDDDAYYSSKRDNKRDPTKINGATTNQFFFRDVNSRPAVASQVDLMKNNKSTSSSSSSSRRSPPIVATSKNARDNDNDDDDARRERQQQQQKSRQTTSAPKQLVDMRGKPLYLTLEQAQRSYQASLVQVSENGRVDQNYKNDDIDDDEDRRSTDSSSGIGMLSRQPSSWEELGITDAVLLDNLDAMGCTTPLSVQAKTCLEIVGQHGKDDVVVGTYTGSGKTLAFLVPLAQSILSEKGQNNNGGDERDDGDDTITSSSTKGSGIQTIIIAPGRELASQIVSVARELFQGTGLGVMLAIGGTTFDRNLQQIRKRKPDFVIGTPGRIAELIVGRPGERTGRLLNTMMTTKQKLVLDEFDALLEYRPHREPTTAILDTLKQRYGDRLQCILCSATASDMLHAAANKNRVSKYLRPGFVQIMADRDDILVTTAAMGNNDDNDVSDDDDESQQAVGTRVSRSVIHGVVPVPHRRLALETLRRVLHTDPIPQQILIFVHDAYRVDLVVEKLSAMGIVAAALHGGRNSEKVDRADVSKALREGYVGIVVATELAARGLDAPLLTHVINLDLPTDASFYAHRAGRVGRCGRPGVVLNFTTDPKERKVPQKFASKLGIDMHVIDVRNGKLNIVEEANLQ